MKKKTSVFAASLLGLLLASVAPASVIGNGPPNQSGGSDLNAFLEADDFVVGVPGATITQIKFWALLSDPSDFAGSMDWAFYSDLGGIPDAEVGGGNASATGAATGQTTLGLLEYSYTISLNQLLAAGNYWLVLHNGPSNAIPSTSFYWAWSNGDSGNSVSQDVSPASPTRLTLNPPVSPTWTGNSAELAFELTASAPAAAPEPLSSALVGGGILLAALLRRKQGSEV